MILAPDRARPDAVEVALELARAAWQQERQPRALRRILLGMLALLEEDDQG